MSDAAVHVVDAPGDAGALLRSPRPELLAALRERADSASGLARRLGLPRQRVNYHVRELERLGAVELAESRPRRGCVERVVRPTAGALVIGGGATGTPAPESIADRFSAAYVIALAARVVSEVGRIAAAARRAEKPVATLGIDLEVSFVSAADRAAFADELESTLTDLAAKHHAGPGGRSYRLAAICHPAMTRAIDDQSAGEGGGAAEGAE